MSAPPTITRATTHDRLTVARSALRDAVAGETDATMSTHNATPEWTALDILRHIGVWNELCTRCLADWLGGRDWILTFASEDQFNIEMVAARAATSLAQALASIEQAYDAYEQTLAERSDEQLAEQAPAPWGQMVPRIGLIWFEIQHDMMHINQMRAALGKAEV
ncbi:MAG: DinB family protein [Chloroflexales bacterium]